MSKADLHVHSKYSEHLSEQFLYRMGAAESFTEPEFIYQTAKERGMDLVTITDHNRIEGSILLNEKHPLDTFTGVEATAYFPEDNCRIHVLIYGLNAREFDEVQKIRANIYDLRQFLKENDLAHSVAHATYYKNRKELTVTNLEKLILLFDVFEGINGGRNKMNNQSWTETLKLLTPGHIEDLYRKHRIEPFSGTPWLKGFTGGSDDHAGLFIGNTFTTSSASTPREFLQSLKGNQTGAGGKHNDFHSFAFTLYKVAYDFSKTKRKGAPSTFVGRLNELVFEKKALRLREKLALRGMKYRNRKKKDMLQESLIDLVEAFKADTAMPVDRRLEILYDKLAGVTDELLLRLVRSLKNDLVKGDLANLFRNASSSILGILLSVPFFMSFKYLYQGRGLIQELEQAFGKAKRGKRILWFADSVGESFKTSLKDEQDLLAAGDERRLKVITASREHGHPEKDRSHLIAVPCIDEIRLSRHKDHAVQIPSALAALKKIYEFDPDEIYVSTSGPMGLLGILASRLLDVKCVGVCNADYHAKLKEIADNESLTGMFESYTRWFYAHMDEIRVPTEAHLDMFENVGLNRSKMNVYREEFLIREMVREMRLGKPAASTGKDFDSAGFCGEVPA